MEHPSRYLNFLRCINDLLFEMIGAIGARQLSLLIWGALPLRRLGRPNSPKTISSLPPELLCEIFLFMNMQELSSLKMVRIPVQPFTLAQRHKTCRMFYDATKSQQFWQRVLSSLRPVYNQPNFKNRLHNSTLQEVERWGMKSLRNYERWALDVPITFRSNSFNYSTAMTKVAALHEAELLPGGRWLLTSNSRGQYLLYDLHSPPRAQELFDPREYDRKDKTSDCLDSFATWINITAEELSFRIVVWKWDGPNKEGHVTRTYIYEINISEDERGLRLSTKRIYSARSYLFRRRRPSIAISDKYLVEARTTGHSSENTARWKLFMSQYNSGGQGNPAMDDITVLLGKTDASAVQKVFITSDDHVVTIGPYLIAIYTVSHLAQCNKQQASPLHRIDLSVDIVVSVPFPDRGYHWIIALHSDEFWLIRLSRDMTSPLRVVTLGRNPLEPGHEWFAGQITQDVTICRYPDWTAKILTYSWDVEMTQCTFKAKNVLIPKNVESPRRLENVGVDMANGRVVYLDGLVKYLTILHTQ